MPRFEVEAQYFIALFIAFWWILVGKLAILEHSRTVFLISGHVHLVMCSNLPIPVWYLECSALSNWIPSPLLSR
eukprot:7101028-Ditylum_brightwellii.AAC.1